MISDYDQLSNALILFLEEIKNSSLLPSLIPSLLPVSFPKNIESDSFTKEVNLKLGKEGLEILNNLKNPVSFREIARKLVILSKKLKCL